MVDSGQRLGGLREKVMSVFIKGEREGSLSWWNCSESCLYQYPGINIVLYICKILSLKGTEYRVYGISLLFLTPACKSTVKSYAPWLSGISSENANFNIWKSFNVIHHMWYTGRIMPSWDIHDLISVNCEYVNLHGKKEFKLSMELSLLISSPWGEEIISVYLRGPEEITRFHISERNGGGNVNVTVI